MHIERFGSGEQTYVGLHGWNGDHRTFLPLLNPLPPAVSFLSPDLPGCGLSPPPVAWNLAEIAQDISREIVRASPGPVTLVGNCSGAILALLIARHIPSIVGRVMMIDAFASWPWYFRVFLSPAAGRYAYMATFANPAGRWLTNTTLVNKRKRGTDLTRGFQGADHESTYRYLLMLRDTGAAAQFADLPLPVDIVYGKRTFSAVRTSALEWARILPRTRTFELNDAGHLPILEATSQLRQILFGENLCSTQRPTPSLNFARP